MGIVYDVFSNSGLAGAPINYAQAIGTTSGLTFNPGALAANATYKFGVRARDTVSGLSETNIDAVLTIVTDANGNDITNRPFAPVHLTAFPASAGALLLTWAYPFPSAPKPTGFRVYLGQVRPNYGAPAAIVAFRPLVLAHRTVVTGLVGGAKYWVAVRAFNAFGEEQNTNALAVTPVSQAPLSVASGSIVGTNQA